MGSVSATGRDERCGEQQLTRIPGATTSPIAYSAGSRDREQVKKGGGGGGGGGGGSGGGVLLGFFPHVGGGVWKKKKQNETPR